MTIKGTMVKEVIGWGENILGEEAAQTSERFID